MQSKDTTVLLTHDDRVMMEDIQQILEQSGIFSVLASDHAAASVMNAYMGSSPAESLMLLIHVKDADKARKILSEGPYSEFFRDKTMKDSNRPMK